MKRTKFKDLPIAVKPITSVVQVFKRPEFIGVGQLAFDLDNHLFYFADEAGNILTLERVKEELVVIDTTPATIVEEETYDISGESFDEILFMKG